jgi:DNA (cytosine-5)-methyltransferase 1
LRSRIEDGLLRSAPIYPDIQSLTASDLPTGIDIVYGGFPCQDISNAGARAGLEGGRSGLFYEALRLIRELKPTFVFLENVAAILSRGGPVVVKEIAKLGYDCRWTVLSASDVGAPHIRKRWWLLAHTNSNTGRIQSRRSKGQGRKDTSKFINDGKKESVADCKCEGELQSEGSFGNEWRWIGDCGWWESEPNVGRVAYGIPNGVDRISSLGNAVVPRCAEEAFKVLMGLVHEKRTSQEEEG